MIRTVWSKLMDRIFGRPYVIASTSGEKEWLDQHDRIIDERRELVRREAETWLRRSST